MLTSPILSQNSSNDNCVVPCATLKNALIMKTDFEKTKLVLSEARDSISIMNKLILSQDSLLVIKDGKIEIYKQNENNYTQVIKLKDDMIGVYEKKYKKEKRLKNIGFGTAGLSILLSLLIVL